ncbi:MAG: hypothetical protein M3132_09290 [Actinomycetia bacterium]|nr:hypothetical protein [Actinomycetes bacterium]
MRDENGTVLLEMIVLGFATLLIVLPTLITIARIVDASAAVENQARSAATWTARHGRLPAEPIIPGGATYDVQISVGARSVTATARSTVTLVSIGAVAIEREVVSVYDAPISPYRSDS